VLTWAGRRAEAAPVLFRAAEVATTPRVEVQVRVQLGSVLRELQRYQEAVAELSGVLRLAERHGELREEAGALGVLGAIRMETGQSEEAVALYTRAIDRCAAIGFRRLEGVNRVNRGITHHHRGATVAALDDFAAAASIFDSIGDRRSRAVVRLNHAVVQHGLLGNDVEARAELELALSFFHRGQRRPLHRPVSRDPRRHRTSSGRPPDHRGPPREGARSRRIHRRRVGAHASATSSC
jgi:tetratricopeptide (TPR) repeat protein